jgi:hypothetical protein
MLDSQSLVILMKNVMLVSSGSPTALLHSTFSDGYSLIIIKMLSRYPIDDSGEIAWYPAKVQNRS